VKRAIIVALVIALVVVVVSVLVSPAVDLEPTALRAMYWLMMLFASLAVVKVGQTMLPDSPRGGGILVIKYLIPLLSQPIVDLDCARLR
jgi:hypothetical protein